MKILAAKYILCCDKNFTILQDYAVIFDKKIKQILPISKLENKKNIKKVPLLMPALVNAHTHLEYSANKASLSYKNFPCWLKSVLEKREFLSKKLSQKLMQKELKNMILSGVGLIGEISSFGLEDEILANCKIKTRFYCEILGTNEKFLDFAFENFYKRLQKAKNLQNELFKPAIAIHSPYSTHPKLAKKALKLAKDENLLLSTHFCESKEESAFLQGKNSSLKEVLQMINPDIKAFYTKEEFLSMFDMQKTLFAHCVHTDFKGLKHIAHCPFSNRLLSGGSFDLLKAKKSVNIALGTDGLSSNISLNLWDEMRAALLVHKQADIYELAKDLLLMSSINGAKALGFDSGEIKNGKSADIAVFNLPNDSSKEQLALNLILHTKKAKALFINGEQIF